MKIICCVCQKTKNRKGWANQVAEAKVQLSHGYCPQCYKQIMERIEGFFSMDGYRKSA